MRSKRANRLAYALTAFVLAGLIISPVAFAQTAEPPIYFHETGHTVREPLVSYFNRTGGVARYGYPITDVFADPASGLQVQYFEKARLEWHPANPDPYKVQLGLLGDQLAKRQPPIPVAEIPSPSDPTCRYFGETGHKTCHKFWEYWSANGGLDMFGYPISAVQIENKRIVQYFQRARFEWHPEKPDGQRVQLAPLGRIYFDFLVSRGQVDASLDQPQPPGSPNTHALPTRLRARGTVGDSSLPANATQIGFVAVVDQLGRPMRDASVTLIVHYPSGDQHFDLLPTNAQGTTAIKFPAGKFGPGTVISMEFVISYSGLATTTRTSYMIWFY